MKLLLIILFATLSNIMIAQSNQKTFELKNGSIVTGTVVEEIPGESYKVKTADGNIFVFKYDEVKKITLIDEQQTDKTTKEDIEIDEISPKNMLQTGASFYNMNEVVLGGAGLDGTYNMTLGIGTINGIQINALQLGIGVEYIVSPSVYFELIPVYLDIRYLFSERRNSLTGIIDLGLANGSSYQYIQEKNGFTTSRASYTYSSDFFFRIGLGYNFPLSTKLDANINLSYMSYSYDMSVFVNSTTQSGTFYSSSASSDYYSGTDGAFLLKFGVGF